MNLTNLIEFIQQPWAWWVSGLLISFTMFYLLFLGKRFGVSSNFKTICSLLGAGRYVHFFKADWHENLWNLVFIAGALTGGFIASYYLTSPETVAISSSTITELTHIGILTPGSSYFPYELFDSENIWSLRSMIFLLGGGFLVGFGTRYANGCTSGHAISGLSNLQKWSLVAVIGFFIGGLIMTHILLPYLMKL